MPKLTLRKAGTAAGCRHSYLSKLIKEGRLSRGQDGLVDLDDVRAVLAQSDPAQQRKSVTPAGHPAVTRKAKRSPDPVTTPADARDAVALVARVLAEEGIAADGPPDIQMARLCEVILKSRDRSLRIDERRKTLVNLEAVKRHASSFFVGVRRAIQAMPARHVPEMAARLGVDPGALQAELDRMIHATLTELSEPVVRG